MSSTSSIVRGNPPSPQIEYTIYTYEMGDPRQKGDHSWKKHMSGDNMMAIMGEAEGLHEAGKYQKIEVKKKFFDQKKNRVVDMTLKVFETTPKKDYTIALLAMGAMIAFAAAFAATFFLTRGL